MIDIAAALKASPNGVLATADGKKLKTRVFRYLFSEGSFGGPGGGLRAYFSTESEKPVHAQMKAHPHVSFCTYGQNFDPVLSVNGTVTFVDDTALKTRVLDENPPLRAIHKDPGNPRFTLFYIAVEEIETYSAAGGAEKYKA